MKQLLLLFLLAFLPISVFSQVQGPPPPCGYTPAYVCDDNDDGFAVFNLVDLYPFTFCPAVNPANYSSVTYYETEEDMNNEINPISDPENYLNISSPQTIYYRANKTIPDGDFDILQSENIIEVKRLSAIEKLETYDTDSDGFMVFDLTSVELFCGFNDENNYTVTYHISQADTDLGVNQIVNPSNFFNATNPQTIFVRAEHNNTGYIESTSFQIRALFAIAYPAPYIFACDSFDLSGLDTDILGSQNPDNFVVTYYLTQNDAENNINALPYLYDIIGGAEIYSRVEEKTKGSYAITSFIITIESGPSINKPTAYEICDDTSNDGFEVFDLSSKTSEVVGSQTGLSVSYYISERDANNGRNALPNNYNSSSTTIYVGVKVLGSLCPSVTSLDLVLQDCRDEDNDGVINSDEDINENGILTDDDTDLDSIPDYLDDDDDGDNIDTIDELADQSTISSRAVASKGLNEVIDTDSDTIPNYIDDDDDGDGVLTKDEDYNNNGSPLDDDTNGNNIPDYLESSVALNLVHFKKSTFSMFPNPASEFIELNFDKTINKTIKINIYNIQGKNVYSKVSEDINKSLKIDVFQFSKGVYFLKVGDGISEITKKLILE
ncbi:T9SS type A sorting domain-containing protein [Algibacter marinivivus]|nr:T9SS type A sorting domain-containing protein [Algibacter marinivivus]